MNKVNIFLFSSVFCFYGGAVQYGCSSDVEPCDDDHIEAKPEYGVDDLLNNPKLKLVMSHPFSQKVPLQMEMEFDCKSSNPEHVAAVKSVSVLASNLDALFFPSRWGEPTLVPEDLKEVIKIFGDALLVVLDAIEKEEEPDEDTCELLKTFYIRQEEYVKQLGL
jgi:hypothetical protein